jgi:hypothetical protein
MIRFILGRCLRAASQFDPHKQLREYLHTAKPNGARRGPQACGVMSNFREGALQSADNIFHGKYHRVYSVP